MFTAGRSSHRKPCLLHSVLPPLLSMAAAAATHICNAYSPPINTRSYHYLHTLPLAFKPKAAAATVSRLGKNFSIRAVDSPSDEKPYEILPTGKIAYLDELDVVTFLDPPKDLIPLDPASYSPAAYLWKKIEEIPQERRHRLMRLLNPRLIAKAWQIAGARYADPKLAKRIASNLLHWKGEEMPIELYNCKSSGGPLPIAWINFFKKAIFYCNNGNLYGRFIGGSVLAPISNTLSPLYFMVTQRKEVMPTEQPCDLAYEFGDGHFDLHTCPKGFPRPVKHPYPFNDQVVIYIRHIGPGVSVGQAWQEGKKLQQVPKKFCEEILMVKDYAQSPHN